MATIDFIGLGNRGGGMASNLAKAGHRVLTVDLSEPALAQAVEAGCERAASALTAVYAAGAVVTMLPAGKPVRAVHGDHVVGAAKAGPHPMACSAYDVASERAVGEQASEKGYGFVHPQVAGRRAASWKSVQAGQRGAV